MRLETGSKRANKMIKNHPQEIPNEVVEQQTKKIPNLLFMAFAGASIAASAFLTFRKKQREVGNFVGLWVPTLLILGLYNKLVKVEDEILEGGVVH